MSHKKWIPKKMSNTMIIRLDDQTKEKLGELAGGLRISKAAVIRALINQCYDCVSSPHS